MQGRTRLAAYAFSVDRDALLLARISDRGVPAGEWTLPGGGLDWGEHPEEGMRRELHEETGLSGTITGILGVDSLVLPAGRSIDAVHAVRVVYTVDCRGRPEVVEQDGSVDLARWVPLDELSDYPVVDLVEYALRQAGMDVA